RLPFFYSPQSAADRFAKAFLGRDYGNVMASGDKSWPSIAVMLAGEWQGARAASNERVARRFPSRREPRIGPHFACASRWRRQNSDASTQCDRSRDHAAGAAVESLRVADDPKLPAPGSRLGDLFHAPFRHCHGQQGAAVQLATMAPTGEDAP